MQFQYDPLTSLDDATRNFEQLQGLLSFFLQTLTGQDLRLAFGTANLTWTGANGFATTVTVPHGLGVIPKNVLLTGSNLSASPFAASPFVNGTPDATNIPVSAFTPGVVPAAGTTAFVYWIAIG